MIKILCVLILSVMSFACWSKTYDLHRLCLNKNLSHDIIVEDTSIKGCTLKIQCTLGNPYNTHLLWKCNDHKQLYNFGNILSGFNSHVNFIRISNDEVLVSVIDVEIKTRLIHGRVLQGKLSSIGEMDKEFLKKTSKGFFTFDEALSSNKIFKFSKTKCTSSSSLKFLFAEGCYSRIAE